MDLYSKDAVSVKYACSLGTLCHSAEVLKRNKLKICSYPFDWVFTDADVISDCIQDGFKKFLHKEFFTEPTSRWGAKQSGHKIYDPKQDLCFFFHKDPREEDHYNYYSRCVERFKKMLESKDNKLFLTILAPQITHHPIKTFNMLKEKSLEEVLEKTKNDFLNLNETLKKYTENHHMLILFNVPEQNKNHQKSTKIENVEFLELHTVSNSNGISFSIEEDNKYLDNIINQRFKLNSL